MSNTLRPSATEGFPITNKEFLTHFRDRLAHTEATTEDSFSTLLGKLDKEDKKLSPKAASVA